MLSAFCSSFTLVPLLLHTPPAQVHAAKLLSGEDVVIKVQKKGVQGSLKADLDLLYANARVLQLVGVVTSELSEVRGSGGSSGSGSGSSGSGAFVGGPGLAYGGSDDGLHWALTSRAIQLDDYCAYGPRKPSDPTLPAAAAAARHATGASRLTSTHPPAPPPDTVAFSSPCHLPRQIVGTLREAILEEIDFKLEAERTEQFATFLSRSPELAGVVTVPKVYRQVSGFFIHTCMLPASPLHRPKLPPGEIHGHDPDQTS